MPNVIVFMRTLIRIWVVYERRNWMRYGTKLVCSYVLLTWKMSCVDAKRRQRQHSQAYGNPHFYNYLTSYFCKLYSFLTLHLVTTDHQTQLNLRPTRGTLGRTPNLLINTVCWYIQDMFQAGVSAAHTLTRSRFTQECPKFSAKNVTSHSPGR